MPPAGFVSVPDAIQQLGISRQRVYQLIRMGTLPSIKKSGRVWVPQDAIDARLHRDGQLASGHCISTKEVADFFGVDIRAVGEWRAKGLLHPVKVNNKLCFHPDEIVRFRPPTVGGAGRNPSKPPTRTLRGRFYPEPPEWGRSKGTE